MGVFSKIKRRLPIVGGGGSGSAQGPQTPTSTPRAPSPPPAPEPPARDGDARAFIDGFVKDHPIALFMKGSPSQPMCGFSANAVGILQRYGDVAHVDILLDPEVRQGVKDYSNWPTIPQIYIGGEFLGGSDILAQMDAAGELAEVIEAAVGDGESSNDDG